MEHPERKVVIARNDHDRVICQHVAINPDEQPMLRSCWSGDVATTPGDRAPHAAHWFSVKPPPLAVRRTVRRQAYRTDSLPNVLEWCLIDSGVRDRLVDTEVHDPHPARAARQIM